MALEFITKRRRPTPLAGAPVTEAPSPNSVIGLVATDLTISISGRSVEIKKNGILLTQVIIAEIVNWEISGETLTIFSDDMVPLTLSFTDSNEALTALATLEGAF